MQPMDEAPDSEPIKVVPGIAGETTGAAKLDMGLEGKGGKV